MRPSTRGWDGADAVALAARLRAEVPAPAALAADVAEIVAAIREGGDRQLLELSERHDGARPENLRVARERCTEALEALDPELRAALEAAAANIGAVAEAQRASEPIEVLPGQGQRISISEVPVAAAGIYVPGGRAPYPSTVLMGAIAARCAGVERVVVASPPQEGGTPTEAVLAAAEIAGADEVYAVGGAHAIAALAYGTESIERVDVIAGPGGPWVQEAKLAVSRDAGIDGYAGPSELVVVADGSVPAEWLALDVCAQAEHGDDGLLTVICTDETSAEELTAEIERVAAREPSVHDAPVSIVLAPGIEPAAELAQALAPEHLQLSCANPEALVPGITTAGCIFVGPEGATAFGDYAAGSNHVLPTGGAGRFTGPLGPGTFRRRISVVEMSQESAVELGGVVARIAAAEGFVVHGASALARGGRTAQDLDRD